MNRGNSDSSKYGGGVEWGLGCQRSFTKAGVTLYGTVSIILRADVVWSYFLYYMNKVLWLISNDSNRGEYKCCWVFISNCVISIVRVRQYAYLTLAHSCDS